MINNWCIFNLVTNIFAVFVVFPIFSKYNIVQKHISCYYAMKFLFIKVSLCFQPVETKYLH